MTRAPKRVEVDGRTFIVSYGADRNPCRIVERKMHAPGKPWACWHNASYWSAKHHTIGGPKTLVSRILLRAATSST